MGIMGLSSLNGGPLVISLGAPLRNIFIVNYNQICFDTFSNKVSLLYIRCNESKGRTGHVQTFFKLVLLANDLKTNGNYFVYLYKLDAL